jgi:hypothetical protein
MEGANTPLKGKAWNKKEGCIFQDVRFDALANMTNITGRFCYAIDLTMLVVNFEKLGAGSEREATVAFQEIEARSWKK